MKKIKIRIRPDGIVQAETLGIKGDECTKYRELISRLTGSRVIESEYTSEYYEVIVEKNEIKGEIFNGN